MSEKIIKCENCGSEKIEKEITLITRLGWTRRMMCDGNPMLIEMIEGDPDEPQYTAGWKGKVTCLECGSESEWYGDAVDVNQGDITGIEKDLMAAALVKMADVAPPDQTTIPEILPCRKCGRTDVSIDERKTRVFLRHNCEPMTLIVGKNKRQAILGWNRKQEKKADE